MVEKRHKIVRVSTIPLSLKVFCLDLFEEIKDEYDILAVSSPGKEMQEIATKGIRTSEIKMERKIAPLADLKSLIKLTRLFKKEKPDMVHSITPKAGLLSMIAAWLAGVPIRMHSFTGLVFPTSTGIKRAILKTTDRVTCACATHIHAEGQGVKDDLERGKITAKEIKVLGYGNIRGINLDKYDRTPEIMAKAHEIRKGIGATAETLIYLFVGRAVTDKGINELVGAYTKIDAERRDTRLIIVGSEEPHEDPLPETTKETIKNNAHILHINSWIDDVRPYYAAADIMVLPSYREGFPNAVIEAGAMGLPSIVTDINGSREIIKEGHNGLIVPPHDKEKLYKSMLTLADENDKRNALSSEARNSIATRFEDKYVRNCLKKHYKELLSSVACQKRATKR